MSGAPRTQADIGGRLGFGPVLPEINEPWFHAPWERRAFAVTLAMGATGAWTLDQSRAARERLPDYLQRSYFEIWAGGIETLTRDRGLMSAEEIEAGRAMTPGPKLPRKLMAADVAAALAKGSSTERPIDAPPRFKVGDHVRTRDVPSPKGHTRLPRYVQGKVGVVTLDHGGHVLPDTNGEGAGECPERLYTVRFSSRDLFGSDADPTASVSVDAWDSYLALA